MTSFASGQEEAISLFWLATRAGPSFHLFIFRYNTTTTTTTSTTRTTNLPLHYNKPNANGFLHQTFLNTPAIMH